MGSGAFWHRCGCVFAALAILTLLFPAGSPAKREFPGGDIKIGKPDKGDTGQAALDLDSPGCPTTFGEPASREGTTWSLDQAPTEEAALFEATVREGPTGTFLYGSGSMVVTNRGVKAGVLHSAVLLLEQRARRKGDSIGPSGKNWKVLRRTTAVASPACEALGIGRTCYGEVVPEADDEGSWLVLYDEQSNDVMALRDLLPVPPALDGNGDGLVDDVEACAQSVLVEFDYAFDITGLRIEGPGDGEPGTLDDLRLNLIVTFGSAGGRGGSGASCTKDVDCSGALDGDDPSTPLVDESEEDNIRSIQQRLEFEPVPLPEGGPACQTVVLAGDGPWSLDPACASVEGGETLEFIDATGNARKQSVFLVGAPVTCADGEEGCETSINNRLILACEDGAGLVEGSPTTSGMPVACSGGGPGGGTTVQSGDLCTYVPAAWGTTCTDPANPGSNHEAVGCMRDVYFGGVFPDGLAVGDNSSPDDPAAWTLYLTGSDGVRNYLSALSNQPPAPLSADVIDPAPGNTSSGIFGQEVAAMDLNFGFDLGSVWIQSDPPPARGGDLFLLEYVSCDEGLSTILVGERVARVRAWANCALSGKALTDCAVPAGIGIEDLNRAVNIFNRNFENCQANLGCLDLIQQAP